MRITALAKTAASLVLLVFIFAATVAPLHAKQLNDAEITGLVKGKRVYLATPFGGEFPLYYRTNGKVDGDGQALGLGRYFTPKETGKWWVSDNQLCQQWKTWYKGKTACFKLTKTGPKSLIWLRNDGRKGKARVE